jgi:hypothetical protein
LNSPISKQQIEEWIENPVTIAFKHVAEYERDELMAGRGVDVYHPFEPTKTQEILAGLNGAVDTWDFVIGALEGEGWDEE